MSPLCLTRSEMLWRMANVYHETVSDWGITANGWVVEFWRGDTGSWSLVLSKVAWACIYFSGVGGRPV